MLRTTPLTSLLPANHPWHCCRPQTFRDHDIVYIELPIEVIKQGLKGMGKIRMGTGTGILRVKAGWGPGQGSL